MTTNFRYEFWIVSAFKWNESEGIGSRRFKRVIVSLVKQNENRSCLSIKLNPSNAKLSYQKSP